GSVYTVANPGDRLHRPPFVASFRARGPPASGAFTFTLINIHTDPDETAEELDALAEVLASVRRDGEDDVVLLGDLNADARHLRELGETPGLVPAITGITTNTRRTEEYDQVLLDSTATREFTGAAGVHDFRERFGLSLEQALKVSDHFPVWAEFSISEERE
ncbi:MAG: exonuclease/endonuclease/phosphatase family protein, partial [Planctomycetaceae bacterium]